MKFCYVRNFRGSKQPLFASLRVDVTLRKGAANTKTISILSKKIICTVTMIRNAFLLSSQMRLWEEAEATWARDMEAARMREEGLGAAREQAEVKLAEAVEELRKRDRQRDVRFTKKKKKLGIK